MRENTIAIVQQKMAALRPAAVPGIKRMLQK
jgi:hypothetical protein